MRRPGQRGQATRTAVPCGPERLERIDRQGIGILGGAFTGAQARRRGLFEQADGGTLFLDEVGEMSPRVQAMLLRVLQEGTLRRVGGERTIDVDVRVVAATHRDLPELVTRGEFREDLYYRLAGATLLVPPLRERGGDLERLVAFFLDEQGGPRPWPTPAAWRCLQRYAWPGNVRQLRAEVVRWTVFCDRSVGVDELSPELRALAQADDEAPVGVIDGPIGGPTKPSLPTGPTPSAARTLADAVRELEHHMLREALAREGSLMGAARALGIDRNTLKRKVRRLGLR